MLPLVILCAQMETDKFMFSLVVILFSTHLLPKEWATE